MKKSGQSRPVYNFGRKVYMSKLYRGWLLREGLRVRSFKDRVASRRAAVRTHFLPPSFNMEPSRGGTTARRFGCQPSPANDGSIKDGPPADASCVASGPSSSPLAEKQKQKMRTRGEKQKQKMRKRSESNRTKKNRTTTTKKTTTTNAKQPLAGGRAAVD